MLEAIPDGGHAGEDVDVEVLGSVLPHRGMTEARGRSKKRSTDVLSSVYSGGRCRGKYGVDSGITSGPYSETYVPAGVVRAQNGLDVKYDNWRANYTLMPLLVCFHAHLVETY